MPGLIVLGLIVLLRLLGLLQPLEWWAFDQMLRLRWAEPVDQRILIVGIDEQDIQSVGSYPIPDAQLAELIGKLQAAQPRVIGLDIFRDLAVPPGHEPFTQASQAENVFGIDTALPFRGSQPIPPPPSLPPERVGFADSLPDSDGALRRALIATPSPKGYRFSLPLLLAERYLAAENSALVMENGRRDLEAIRFGNTELTRFRQNAGGYVRVDDRGNQILINYHTGKPAFQTVSLSDVLQGKISPNQIRDRLVLIGMTATSVGDLKQTSVAESSFVPGSGLIYGVEVHAQIASQILSAVLQNRTGLIGWPVGWNYLWIVLWGLVGIGIGRFLVNPGRVLLGSLLVGLGLVGLSMALLWAGWWLALVPALLALMLNSWLTALFYRHQREFQFRLQERQQVIDQICTEIHAVPVQTVVMLLRRVREGHSPQQIEADMQRLDQELRMIEESAQQARLMDADEFYLCNGLKLNLQQPLDGLLREVYRATLSRTDDFPSFATVVKVPQFEAIDQRRLSPQQKQGLCRFLEEALCNAGKYAQDMTRLSVSCKTVNGWTRLQIVDNGAGLQPVRSSGGYGTKQAQRLARQLGGRFRRQAHHPNGTICELCYPVNLWRWLLSPGR
jgi:CHASE2 domain-containing sensor protein